MRTSFLKITALLVGLLGFAGVAEAQSAYTYTANAGSILTQRRVLNCTGALTCSDDAVNLRTNLNVGGAAGNLGIGTASPLYGLHVLGGQARVQQLATPAAPAIANVGAAGATTYTYFVVARDRQGNQTLASAAGVTLTGNATLNGTNYNTVTWSAVPGAVTYDVLKTNTSTSVATGLTVLAFSDQGGSTSAYTAATRNATSDTFVDGNVGVGLVAPLYGMHLLGGQARVQALATPTAPVVSNIGAAGGTTYTYFIVARDKQGNATLVSSSGVTNTGNASLTTTNYNTITWSAVPGAATYDLLKTNNTTSLATGLTGLAYNDQGGSTAGYTNPPRNATADLVLDGQLSAAAGSATAPAYAFTGSLGTGSYSPGANQWAVATNGTQAILVDATQNTSISTGAGATTLSSTAATARAGMRNANTRNIVRAGSVAPPDCSGGALNLTVTQFLDAGIATCATTQTITFPTWQGASGIVQALPGAPAVGDIVEFLVSASAANAVTVAAGTGGTLGGSATVPANSDKLYRCRLTNVTAASEAATCY